jgi:hypothetical protein
MSLLQTKFIAAKAVTAAKLGSASATSAQAIFADGSGGGAYRSIVAGDIPTLNQNTTGSAASFTGSLSGDVTGTQSATVISAATVTGKLLTGYVSGAGTVSATDSILTAIQKINGNVAAISGSTVTSVNSISPVSGNVSLTSTNIPEGTNLYYTNARTIAALLTGYSAASGVVSSSDSILSALQKIDGNDALKLPLAGGTMSGAIAMGANKITGLLDPTNPQDAVTKAYSDAALAGLSWKTAVQAASVANVSVASAPAALDSYAMVSGDRILLKDQTAASENGIYIFNGAGSALTRATDANTWSKIVGFVVYVVQGTTNAGAKYNNTNVPGGTIGTTAITITVFAAASALDGIGTAGYNAYWTAAHTLAGEQYTGTVRGGLGVDASVLTGLLKFSAGVASASSLVNADVSATAAISFSKLAALPSGNILVGSAGAVATAVALSGEASLVASGAITLSNAAVIAKVLTGYVAGAGTVSAADSILSAIQKIDANQQTSANQALSNLSAVAINTSLLPSSSQANVMNIGSQSLPIQTVYSGAFFGSNLTVAFTGDTTSGSNVITNVTPDPTTAGLNGGSVVSYGIQFPNINASCTITSVTSTSITLAVNGSGFAGATANATASAAAQSGTAAQFAAYRGQNTSAANTPSGPSTYRSGDAVGSAAQTGPVTVKSGNSTSGESGFMFVTSGNSGGAKTGDLLLKSGNNTSGSGVSGTAALTTGTATGTSVSGAAYLTTGSSVNGNSGGIQISAGLTSGTGIRGNTLIFGSSVCVGGGQNGGAFYTGVNFLPGTFTGTTLSGVPTANDNVINIGSSASRFASVHALTVNADAGALTLNGTGLNIQGTSGNVKLTGLNLGVVGVIQSDASGNLSSSVLSILVPTTVNIVLAGTDITNQYVDLGFVASGTSASVNSVQLSVYQGLPQLKGTDFTVSLTGGAGGLTRLTFAGDLATGGPAALVAGDILMVAYSH